MKTVWVSALAGSEQGQARVAATTGVLKRYGLGAQGHFWNEANDKLAWRQALAALLAAKADVWLILAGPAAMAKPAVRYGLSLMAAALRNARGANFPVLVLGDGQMPAEDALPPLLQPAAVLDGKAGAWPAKVVAKANMGSKAEAPDYRLDILGEERLGQWFEIGPRAGGWQGVVFGVAGAGAEIDFQAVGPKGSLPDKTVLEFAQQGLRLEAGGREFSAWAVRNRLEEGTSYFARVKGSPEAILFMPYAEDDNADATLLALV